MQASSTNITSTPHTTSIIDTPSSGLGHNDGNSLPVGTITGIVLGGVGGVSLVCAAVFFALRRRKRRRSTERVHHHSCTLEKDEPKAELSVQIARHEIGTSMSPVELEGNKSFKDA